MKWTLVAKAGILSGASFTSFLGATLAIVRRVNPPLEGRPNSAVGNGIRVEVSQVIPSGNAQAQLPDRIRLQL